MTNEYQQLLQKLDEFIKKFYKNQIIRGTILSLLMILSLYLFASLSEYYAHFSTSVRTTIFYSVIASIIGVVIIFIIIPTLHYFKIGKIISHKQAAIIISQHFSEIKDKLLNTLELASLHEPNYSPELVMASIEQRIMAIKPIPIKTAINLRKNLKYAKYLAACLLLIVLIFSIIPEVFTEASVRIMKHDTYFEPAAPFRFRLLNDSLFVQKGGDFTANIEIEGSYIPSNVSIVYGGNTFLMKKKSNTRFNYEFKNINNSLDIYFTSDNYQSTHYKIQVLPSPTLINFTLTVDAPEYTGENDKIYDNVGDISVPYGSKITWNFKTKDIERLKLDFNDSLHFTASGDSSNFHFSQVAKESSKYSISVANKYFIKNNILAYYISVVPDLFPSISVKMMIDTASLTSYYFKGTISDDYGFKKLVFNYRSNDTKDLISIAIPININTITQEFYYGFDFSTIKKETTEAIEYYFEVWDNDGISGSKSTKSEVFEFKIPSKQELAEMEKASNERLEDMTIESLKLSKEIKKDVENLTKQLVDNNISDWEKSKSVKEITDKQKKLEDLIKQINEENKAKNDVSNSFSEQSQEILDKQKQIEDLLNSVLTDELKKLLEELNKLRDDFDPDQFKQMSKDLKANYEDLSKQLDRNLEMLRKMDVENKINNSIDRLHDLAERQQELSKKSEEGKTSDQDLLEKQQSQQQELQNISQVYKEAMELNQKLSSPMKMSDFEKQQNDVKNEMSQGEQNLQSGKNKKASKNQKNAAEQMEQLAQDMQNELDKNNQEEASENEEDIRQVLDNLVQFSFDQEALMGELDMISTKDPKYQQLAVKQKKLQDDFKVINDSLMALAKRTPAIGNTVNKEMVTIDKNYEKILTYLDERRINNAKASQQLIMTSANNLALLLNESLDAMQQQSQQSSGQCKKPGKKNSKQSSKESLGSMKQLQESLKKQLESAIQQMKDGQGKPNGDKGMSKQLSQMLAQQEIFEKMIQDLQSGESLTPQTQQMLNEIKKLAGENKTDIINRTISPTTLNRQQQIVTRLLQAENAENQREQEKKRESNEAKIQRLSNPKQFFESKKNNNTFNESLRTTNLNVNNFYKNKYKEYLLKLIEE